MKKAGIHRPPEWIIVLGGGGMPSETGLIRTWYAAKLGIQYPQAKIIIALPGDSEDSLSSVCLMKQEIVQKGIAPDRILIEDSGTNTRSQSLFIFQMIQRVIDERDSNRVNPGNDKQATNPQTISSPGGVNLQPLILVTSPEHLFRAVLTFRKVNFKRIDGFPAFDRVIESDLAFKDAHLGGRRWVPEMGNNITVRYRFWSQLKYLGLVGREYLAITYYWMKGWI